MGAVLVGLALFLVFRQPPQQVQSALRRGYAFHAITDRQGVSYSYSYSQVLALVFGLGAGVFASFFGVGGGIVLVPLMIQFLHLPPPIATATGVAIFLITSISANTTHILAGTLVDNYGRALALAVGAVIGGQLGARVSQRFRATSLVRALALGLGLVGLRLVVTGWGEVLAFLAGG
jgi:uncharacterized membrane protein YfcA